MYYTNYLHIVLSFDTHTYPVLIGQNDQPLKSDCLLYIL